MDPLVIWSLLLLAIGLGLVIAEFFIPSSGVIAVLAVVCFIAAVVLAFKYNLYFGAGVVLAGTLAIPAILYAAVQLWPHSAIGKLILIPRPENSDDVLPQTEELQRRRKMLGRYGVAKTKMLPSGAVLIDGQIYDALSLGMPIDAGQPIRVVELRRNQLIVKPAERIPPAQPEPGRDEDRLLSRPVEAPGPDDLDDPLA